MSIRPYYRDSSLESQSSIRDDAQGTATEYSTEAHKLSRYAQSESLPDFAFGDTDRHLALT